MPLPSRDFGNGVLLTVCCLVLVGFVLVVSLLVAHVVKDVVDHFHDEVTQQQTLGELSAVNRNVIDVRSAGRRPPGAPAQAPSRCGSGPDGVAGLIGLVRKG